MASGPLGGLGLVSMADDELRQALSDLRSPLASKRFEAVETILGSGTRSVAHLRALITSFGDRTTDPDYVPQSTDPWGTGPAQGYAGTVGEYAERGFERLGVSALEALMALAGSEKRARVPLIHIALRHAHELETEAVEALKGYLSTRARRLVELEQDVLAGKRQRDEASFEHATELAQGVKENERESAQVLLRRLRPAPPDPTPWVRRLVEAPDDVAPTPELEAMVSTFRHLDYIPNPLAEDLFLVALAARSVELRKLALRVLDAPCGTVRYLRSRALKELAAAHRPRLRAGQVASSLEEVGLLRELTGELFDELRELARSGEHLDRLRGPARHLFGPRGCWIADDVLPWLADPQRHDDALRLLIEVDEVGDQAHRHLVEELNQDLGADLREALEHWVARTAPNKSRGTR